ncbi:magnesium/cobalt transporter CorA [Thermodesulfobacteriota bacterium]
MLNFLKKTSKKAGLPPGTLVHVGEKKTEYVRIRVIDYDGENLEEREVETIEECFHYKDSPSVTWINIDGLHDVDLIRKIGNHFGFHTLVMEDIIHTEHRSKMEDFDQYIFIILKMLSYEGEYESINFEQFSLVLGENFIISFQERFGNVFNPVRERLRKKSGRIRQRRADYLMYALLDAVVDNYFSVLDKIGVRIESCEDKMLYHPDEAILHEVHTLKSELTLLRRSIWPQREMISGMQRIESNLIQDNTHIYLRDVHDHTIQTIDIIEAFKDMVSNLADAYISNLSNRMNEIMKVLTVIATLFIPLTFMAGIYGMNFKYMPELEWPWGYPVLLGLMFIIIVIMLLWFKRKRFL